VYFINIIGQVEEFIVNRAQRKGCARDVASVDDEFLELEEGSLRLRADSDVWRGK
jgi:hypothetical protein